MEKSYLKCTFYMQTALKVPKIKLNPTPAFRKKIHNLHVNIQWNQKPTQVHAIKPLFLDNEELKLLLLVGKLLMKIAYRSLRTFYLLTPQIIQYTDPSLPIVFNLLCYNFYMITSNCTMSEYAEPILLRQGLQVL